VIALPKSARRLVVAACAALCCSCLSGCFLMKQGYYVVKYTTGSKSIASLERRADTPEDLKRFFSLVHDIRAFAFDSVGLKKNDNFTTYVKVDQHYLINAVFAAGKTDFTPYEWHFPFFGSFPDIGYFDRRDAEAEAGRLSKKGYDTYIGRMDAFSTLGFFSDPVYSFMKDFSLFEIASLIIHEETHATLFIKNQVQFNEEMATFFGNEGALRFIKAKYGDASKELKNAERQSRDYKTYIGLIDSLYHRLKNVYDGKTPLPEKLQRKQTIIGEFKNYVNDKYDSLFLSPNFKGLKTLTINNAFIAADITYTFDLDEFYSLYQKKNRDFKAMLSSLKVLNKSNADPHEVMGKL